ncbi:hypothetical protein RvY_15379 [Ramazzottius varieornatus]|uniref:Conserved oligomeric Golgi complex subunit 1 n=1 Tax=Ramazzottius varieornatus TaxID=947166 RepID=A0A1D1VW01_RAMVA|nr:hypothetical protein RvY_15379 [Ramazzottius varieornatus]
MDVDSLCRKHTLAELKEIEKKLRTDVERKKEELRELVSVRYRDLIDAADKIQGMHRSITNVVDHLNHFRSVEVTPVTTEKAISHINHRVAPLNDALSSALLLAPETIMQCLDNCDTLTAALTYAFVRSLVWQRNIERPRVSEDTQWTFLRAYSNFISADVFKCLRAVSFERQEISGYFVSLMVLNSTAKTMDILPQFLSVRTAIINDFLTTSSNHSVKETVHLTLLSILETFRSVQEVFTSGRLVRFLSDFCRQAQPRIFQELFPNLPDTFLTPLKSYFDGVGTAAAESCLLPVGGNTEKTMLEWFDQVTSMTVENLPQVLNLLPSIQSVVEVHTIVTEALQGQEDCSSSVENIMADYPSEMERLSSLLENSIRQRFSIVLREKLEKILADTTSSLRSSVHNQKDDQTFRNLNAMGPFVPSLTGVEIAATLRPSARPKFPGSVKRQGRPKERDTSVASDPSTHLLSDLTAFIVEVESASTNLHDRSSTTWIDHTTTEAATDFMQHLTKTVQYLPEESSSPDRPRTLSWLHAFLRNVTSKSIPQLDGSSVRGTLAEVLKKELNACSDVLFEQWLTLTLDNFRGKFGKSLEENLDALKWSTDTLPFQTFTLEETDDAGKAVQFSVKVPTKASTCLHSALRLLHESLIGFAANQNVSQSTVPSRCFSLVASVYETFVGGLKHGAMKKNQALQLIFDVKVVGAFVRGRKGLPVGMSRTLQNIVDRISSFIDQIDYNILLPHLDQHAALHAAAVKSCYFSLISLENVPGHVTPALNARIEASKASLQGSLGLSPLNVSFNLLPLSANMKT